MRGKLEEFVRLSLIVLMAAVYGCSSYEAEDVANLQKQLASLVRQVEDMRRDVDGLQGQEAQTIQIEQALEALEAELDVLRSQLGQHETPASQAAVPLSTPTAPTPTAPTPTAQPLEAEVLTLQPQLAKPAEPAESVMESVEAHRARADKAKRTAKSTDCSPVWHWVGKGKTETEIAKLLNISVQAVQLCDEQIGKRR